MVAMCYAPEGPEGAYFFLYYVSRYKVGMSCAVPMTTGYKMRGSREHFYHNTVSQLKSVLGPRISFWSRVTAGFLIAKTSSKSRN
jgi:hypothetical protein